MMYFVWIKLVFSSPVTIFKNRVEKDSLSRYLVNKEIELSKMECRIIETWGYKTQNME